MLKQHVVSGLEPDTRLHDVLDTGSLLEEGVNDGGSGGHQGRLQQVGQDREDGVEVARLGLVVQLDLEVYEIRYLIIGWRSSQQNPLLLFDS